MKHMLLTGVAALSLTVSSTMANAADITLNLSNEYSATSIHGVGDARFASLVAEKTGGSVEVVVHYGGALGYKSADHFDAVGEGALEIADTYGGALGGIDPLFLPTSSFSPSLIHQYITLRNITFCMTCLFACDRVHSRPLRSAIWSAAALIGAGQPGRKSFRNLCSRRARCQAIRAREPVTDRAPGTRKWPVLDGAGHTL